MNITPAPIAFDITATVRACGSQPSTPWLPIAITAHAADLRAARQQFLNNLILSGLDYGSLYITWERPLPAAAK